MTARMTARRGAGRRWTVLLAAATLVAGTAGAAGVAAASISPHHTVAKVAARSAHAPAVTVKVPHYKTKRVCGDPKKGFAACLSIRRVNPDEPKRLIAHAVSPNVTPSGFGPSDLRSAYNLTTTGSAAETVAVVDAQDATNAEADLGVYRAQYGLPACTTANGCFKKINQNGATSPLPTADASWGQEISLDLDMVSAICPSCHILLVEANSATNANLGKSVNAAVAAGADFVSNSYGGSESSSDPSTTTSYYDHPGVVITASAGDDGYGVEYPAASTDVTAVGGTSLSRSTSTARGWTESAWGSASNTNGGTGSGCSTVEPQPAFQTSVVGAACTRRAVADVSAEADPQTGVAVYDSVASGGSSGWLVFGGTSVASPIIASVYALAGTPSAGSFPNSYPYANPSSLNDVTTGTNGSCGGSILCKSAAGWDGPTGLGTPNGTGAFTTGTTSTPTPTPTVTPTSTPTPTPTPTVTPTVTPTTTPTSTPTSTSSCPAGQLLGNPGFESGATIWKTTTGVIGQYTGTSVPHSGTWDAWLDGYGRAHTDTAAQAVTIPAGCTNSTLSFYLHIGTAETTSTIAYDKLTVTAGGTTLATYSNLNKGSGYTLHSFSVGSMAGQTVTLTFKGVEDSSLQTSFVLDDVALNAS